MRFMESNIRIKLSSHDETRFEDLSQSEDFYSKHRISREDYKDNELKKYTLNATTQFSKSRVTFLRGKLLETKKSRSLVCTAITYDPNPPINNSEARPLKEYLIKFLVMNGKKPLILDYKTFVESTRLDYAKGTYVSHPSLEAVKAELAKIIENPILLDRTSVLKTAFLMAWRILFTFVVQVPNGNYSSTKQLNSIQQLIAYCLLTGTKVDIGEIIYSDLVTRLTNKSRQKYVSYPRFVSYALEVLLGPIQSHPIELTAFTVAVNNNEKSMSPIPFTVKKKKGKSQTVTLTLPQSQGPEALGSLPQKRKKPKSKKPPTKAKVTPPLELTEDSEQSHSVSSSHVTDPQDPKINKQLPATVDTTPLLEGIRGNKDSEGLKPPADMEPLTTHESDDEEVFAAREEMDENISPTDEEAKPESSHAQETDQSNFESSCPDSLRIYDNILPLTERQLVKYLRKVSRVLYDKITKDYWAHHEEATIYYADLRASIEGYYEENVDHRDQTDKLLQETMDCLDKNSTDMSNLLKALNGVTETLKVIQDAVKEDLALNKKVLEAIEAYTTNSNNITELLSLAKTFDFFGLKSLVKTMKAALDAQNVHLADLSPLKARKYRGENVTQAATEEPPSHTERETDDIEIQETKEDKMEKEQESEESTKAVLISPFKPLMRTNLEVEMMTSPSTIKLTDTVLEIPTPNSGAKIKAPYMINGKMHYFTNDEINARMKKEDQIKKAAEEAKMFAMTKTEVIKVVHEEAEKIGLDPKIIVSAKEGPIIQKKKNTIVKDLMISLGKSSIPILRKKEEAHPKIRVLGLECNQRLPEGVLIVNNMVFEESEYGMFFTDVFVMDSMIKTLENVIFYMKLKKLIAEHPDQEKLQSKKVKLKSVRYKLD
ncbi:hypothetical protein Tco_0818860 [Tanacetum coccineum]